MTYILSDFHSGTVMEKIGDLYEICADDVFSKQDKTLLADL